MREVHWNLVSKFLDFFGICHGLTFHKETSRFISLEQLNTEFSLLLGRELRKIQRFLVKSWKNPLPVHSLGGSRGILASHPSFPKIPDIAEDGRISVQKLNDLE